MIGAVSLTSTLHRTGSNIFAGVRDRWSAVCDNVPAWFLVFSQLYLSALLLHYGKRWRDPEVTVAVLIVVLWAALKPRRIEPFIVAQLLVLTTTVVDYPRIANHAAVQMFIAIFVLIVVLSSVVRRCRLPCDHIASGLRGLAVVLYFYVGFHKLNTGFLNPATSCANWYHRKLLDSAFDYGGPLEDVFPVFLIQWSPKLAVAAELVAFVLLLFRPTLLLGLCVALPIHLYVSLSGFVDFSSLMHSIMFLFLPVAVVSRPGVRRTLSAYHVVALGIAVVTHYMVAEWDSGIGAIRTFQGVAYDAAVLAVVAVVAFAIRSEPRREAVPMAESNEGVGLVWHRWWKYPVFPAVVLLWGALPYIGLSTNGSLTMFSNLVTASGYNNHVIVDTEFTDGFGFQDDLVQVIDMEPELADNFRYSPVGDLVTRSEIAIQVRRTAREQDRPLMGFLMENGEPTFYADLRASPYNEWPFWVRWLSFRKVDPVGEAQCRW